MEMLLSKSQNAKVSVVISLFNKSRFIESTIESVMAQSYQNIEIIIVDDCSTDDSYQTVRRMSEKDDRLVLLQNLRNSGTAVTRNFGMKRASGEYILILDGDDLLTPWAISHLVFQLSQSSFTTKLCFGHSISIDEENRILPTVDLNDDLRVDANSIRTWIMRNVIGSGSGALFCRELLDKTGYFDDSIDSTTSTGCDDWIFYLSARRFTEFLMIPSTTLAYRSVSDAQSQNTMSMWRSHKRLINIAKQWYPERHDCLFDASASRFAFRLATNAIMAKKFRQGASMLFLSAKASSTEFTFQGVMLIIAIFRRRVKRLRKHRNIDNASLTYSRYIDKLICQQHNSLMPTDPQ